MESSRFWYILAITMTVLGVTQSATRAPNTVSPRILREAINLLPVLRRAARDMLNETVKKEALYVRRLRYHSGANSGAFKAVQNFLGATEQAKQMSYGAFMQLNALKLLKQRLHLDKASFEQLLQELPDFLASNSNEVEPDDPKFVARPEACPYPHIIDCDFDASFRTFDGCCNNLKHPLWGASFQPLVRLLSPDYADGLDSPRSSKYDTPLPSARLISKRVHDNLSNPSNALTHLAMLFGQFMDHDLSRTAISKLSDDDTGFGGIEDVMCGEDGCRAGNGEYQSCLPIDVPEDDPVFKDKRCLMFVRTLSVPDADCKIGPRQQLNQITSYLDASQLYGSTRRQADSLRDLASPDRGRLKMQKHPKKTGLKELMPPWEQFSQSDLCRGANDIVKCFLAGDGRVNENLGLMSLHTVFSREHNRIEAELHALNPHWRGDRLFFETRRILGAMWQRIIYNEYLPVVLGDEIMEYYELKLKRHGYHDGYDSDIRVDVANSFATAALRFGHSQIQDMIKLMGQNYDTVSSMHLSNMFRSPGLLYRTERNYSDDVLRGFCSQEAQSVDPHLSSQIVDHLFPEHPPLGVGTDLAAINIQRGREHGLPGYVAWREWCGLGRPKTFADLTNLMPQKVADIFAASYEHVEDIDLFPAGISEYHVRGAVLGPTFACILANQFQRSRIGDRFWHENRNHPYRFTLAQLAEIRKATLAKIICTNGETISLIQRRVLLQPFQEVYRKLCLCWCPESGEIVDIDCCGALNNSRYLKTPDSGLLTHTHGIHTVASEQIIFFWTHICSVWEKTLYIGKPLSLIVVGLDPQR